MNDHLEEIFQITDEGNVVVKTYPWRLGVLGYFSKSSMFLVTPKLVTTMLYLPKEQFFNLLQVKNQFKHSWVILNFSNERVEQMVEFIYSASSSSKQNV